MDILQPVADTFNAVGSFIGSVWNTGTALVFAINDRSLGNFTGFVILALVVGIAAAIWQGWDWYHFTFHNSRNPELRTYSWAEKRLQNLQAAWHRSRTDGWLGSAHNPLIRWFKRGRTRYRNAKFNLADHGSLRPDEHTPPRTLKPDE